MERMIAWVVPSPGYASRPLLGRACREHVESALAEGGLALAASDSLDAGFPVLCVREDAPCVSGKTLAALKNAALGGQTAVLRGGAQTLLAVAFPKGIADSLFKEGLPTSTSLLEQAVAAQTSVTACRPTAPEECIVVQDATGYAAAFRLLRERFAQRHMANGVILLDPDRIVIEAEVEIGPGTLVYGGNTLQGKTVIGAGCTLYPNNRMENAVLGVDTTVESSVLLDCLVGSHTTVGPFAYLRPKTKVGDHCRIGDFVEVKNSSIGNATKISHLTYVGDSDLGQDINLGCGVVFVNYDGKAKSRSQVEDHAFIGCNCNLVAPVHIGKNAYLAAGSTVVEDVPEDSLYVARSRGVIKEGWVKRRKEQGKL